MEISGSRTVAFEVSVIFQGRTIPLLLTTYRNTILITGIMQNGNHKPGTGKIFENLPSINSINLPFSH